MPFNNEPPKNTFSYICQWIILSWLPIFISTFWTVLDIYYRHYYIIMLLCVISFVSQKIDYCIFFFFTSCYTNKEILTFNKSITKSDFLILSLLLFTSPFWFESSDQYHARINYRNFWERSLIYFITKIPSWFSDFLLNRSFEVLKLPGRDHNISLTKHIYWGCCHLLCTRTYIAANIPLTFTMFYYVFVIL